MITYIIQVLLFQVLFLAVYDFFLSKETFHKYNRWYLIGTPLISFILPFIKISTLQKVVPNEVIVYLPEIVLSPQKVIEQTTLYSESSVNYVSTLFWVGASIFAIVFLIKLTNIYRLILKNEIIKKTSYKLVLLPKQSKAFSFFSFIFLGKEISADKQKQIIKHELIHSKQKHSLDLLFFEFLRIAMWFNPLVYLYQQRITLLHEYITDSEVVKTTEKKDYFNKLLAQTFQVENISFVNQFYKHSFIKKRITMMTKNKSKQIKKAKYLLLLPLLASMLFYTSCSSKKMISEKDQEISSLKESIKILEKRNKSQEDEMKLLQKKGEYLEEKLFTEKRNDVSFATIEEVPVYPGCVGTRAQKAACLNKMIQKNIIKSFNLGLVKNLGLSKGKKKIWLLFKIDKDGNVVDAKARAPHPILKEEAERVARELPKMIPGKNKGKKVGMKYTLPISFNVE